MVKVKRFDGTEGRRKLDSKSLKHVEEKYWEEWEEERLRELRDNNPNITINELIEIYNQNLSEQDQRSKNSIRSKLRRIK